MKIPKKPSENKIVSLKELLFPVRIADTFEFGLNSIQSCERLVVGNVNGFETLINSCSNVYELVPNADIFPKVEEILRKANIDFTAQYSMFDYSRFFAEYKINEGGISIGNSDDLIYPRLIIDHSYNGLVKYNLTFGYFRLVCKNGLTVPVEGQEKVNISVTGKHTKSIVESLNELESKLQYFAKNRKKFTEKFEIIAERWIENWSDRVLAVIEGTNVGKRGYNQICDKIKEEAAKFNEGKVNDWLIYNGFNYHLFNAKTKDGKEYETSIDLRRKADEKVLSFIIEKDKALKPKNKGNVLSSLQSITK